MTESNVVAMNGQVIPSLGEANPELVEMLEKMLEDAKSGDLQSLIATGFRKDGMRYAAWADTHPNVYEMAGSITWLHAEYLDRHK